MRSDALETTTSVASVARSSPRTIGRSTKRLHISFLNVSTATSRLPSKSSVRTRKSAICGPDHANGAMRSFQCRPGPTISRCAARRRSYAKIVQVSFRRSTGRITKVAGSASRSSARTSSRKRKKKRKSSQNRSYVGSKLKKMRGK